MRAHTKNMTERLRNRYFGLSDILGLALAAYLSYVLRLERFDLGEYWPGFFFFTALAVLIVPLVFWRAGVYARYWRYASIEEMLLLTGTVTGSAILVGVLSQVGDILFLPSFGVPRSIPFIFAMLALTATAVPRMLVRLTARQQIKTTIRRIGAPVTRVLVVGAGNAGSMIVRELEQNPQLGMQVVGYVDDDPGKQRLQIRSTRVLGTQYDIERVVRERHVNQVVIAMPTAPGKVIRDIVNQCEHLGVQTKIIPGMYELLGGTVSINQMRNVEIEDLLRREPVQTDTAAISALVQNKCVLITGAGGSIGSELCRQLMRSKPQRLVLLGHGENSIFEIDAELRRRLPKGSSTPEIVAVIADIRSPERMRAVFEEYKPEIVFHAAAHKHVHLMETNPAEAITNNVLGTRNVLEASLAVGVDHFVMISSDKAVNPTGIMGASKRAAELLVHQAALRSGKVYVAVRFGNVLGSRGSVVLTFKQQIARGEPITITHPDMARYFMTIPEAVQLVLQSATLGGGGEVFMLDMGEPVKIVDLAHDLIELSGLQVGRDIDIEYTGVRPGEKLVEELFIAGEEYKRTCHEKIRLVAHASNFVPVQLNTRIHDLEAAAQRNDNSAVVESLQGLVPEYQPTTIGNAVSAGSLDGAGSAANDRQPEAVRVAGMPPPLQGLKELIATRQHGLGDGQQNGFGEQIAP